MVSKCVMMRLLKEAESHQQSVIVEHDELIRVASESQRRFDIEIEELDRNTAEMLREQCMAARTY